MFTYDKVKFESFSGTSKHSLTQTLALNTCEQPLRKVNKIILKPFAHEFRPERGDQGGSMIFFGMLKGTECRPCREYPFMISVPVRMPLA
jgi:hypothetical protein